MGRGGGGLAVSVLAFCSSGLSLNSAEVYSFSVKFCLKRTKIIKKCLVLAHLKMVLAPWPNYAKV